MPIPMSSDAILDDLTDRIESGEYPPGSQLPSYRELGELYNVGYTTVSQVVKRLKDSGLVVGVQGRGVFVAED